jgi:hypothetical protein
MFSNISAVTAVILKTATAVFVETFKNLQTFCYIAYSQKPKITALPQHAPSS